MTGSVLFASLTLFEKEKVGSVRLALQPKLRAQIDHVFVIVADLLAPEFTDKVGRLRKLEGVNAAARK
jgi:hypothetical protein